MKSSKKLRRATKSNNGHQSWKNQNGQEKTKTSNEGHKKSKWKPGLIETEWTVCSTTLSLGLDQHTYDLFRTFFEPWLSQNLHCIFIESDALHVAEDELIHTTSVSCFYCQQQQKINEQQSYRLLSAHDMFKIHEFIQKK